MFCETNNSLETSSKPDTKKKNQAVERLFGKRITEETKLEKAYGDHITQPLLQTALICSTFTSKGLIDQKLGQHTSNSLPTGYVNSEVLIFTFSTSTAF